MGTVEAGLPLADPAADADRARLQQLGYKQELKRGLSYALRFRATNSRDRSFLVASHPVPF